MHKSVFVLLCLCAFTPGCNGDGPPAPDNGGVHDLSMFTLDLSCNQIGMDPGCAGGYGYCSQVFPPSALSLPKEGGHCTQPAAECLYWCDQVNSLEVVCSDAGVTFYRGSCPSPPDLKP